MANMRSIENLTLSSTVDPNNPTFVVNDWAQITIVKVSPGEVFVGVNSPKDAMQMPVYGILQFVAEPGTQVWIYGSTSQVDAVYMTQLLPFINEAVSLLRTIAAGASAKPSTAPKAGIIKAKGGC